MLYPWIAKAHVKLGQPHEAAQAYRLAIAATPRRAFLHANLGSVLAALGSFTEALKSFDRALALDPSLDFARRGREAVLASMR